MQSLIRKTLIILFAGIMTVFFCKAAPAETISVSLNGDRLTVDIKDAPIKKILEVLSLKCEASIFMDKSIEDKRVSVSFKDQPMEKAIKRLVAPYNSAVVFSRKQNGSGKKELYISKIKVFESSKGKNIVRISKPAVPAVADIPEVPEAPEAPADPADSISDPAVKKIYTTLVSIAEEEKQLKTDIDQLKASLSDTQNDNEKAEIMSKLSEKKEELAKLMKTTKEHLKKFDKEARQRRDAQQE